MIFWCLWCHTLTLLLYCPCLWCHTLTLLLYCPCLCCHSFCNMWNVVFWVEAERVQVLFIICLYVHCRWRSNNQMGKVNPSYRFNSVTCCACSMPLPRFPMLYAVAFFLCFMNCGERWSFVWLILVELLTITVTFFS